MTVLEAVALVLSLLRTPEGVDWIDRREVACVAEAVYHESRGAHPLAQAAVAHVVLNRAAYGLKGRETACGQIADHDAFPWPHRKKRKTDELGVKYAAEVAVLSYAGGIENPCPGALWFSEGAPKWARNMRKICKIGAFTFWGMKNGTEKD